VGECCDQQRTANELTGVCCECEELMGKGAEVGTLPRGRRGGVEGW
jgi:hypothetical protein